MPRAASRSTISRGDPSMRSQTAPSGTASAESVRLSTTTGLTPYGQTSKDNTVSKVLRPIRMASTVAMNSSYPWGSPPPAGSQSSAPSGRAMNPSRLVAMNTEQRIASLSARARSDQGAEAAAPLLIGDVLGERARERDEVRRGLRGPLDEHARERTD